MHTYICTYTYIYIIIIYTYILAIAIHTKINGCGYNNIIMNFLNDFITHSRVPGNLKHDTYMVISTNILVEAFVVDYSCHECRHM